MRSLLLILMIALPASSNELWDLLQANRFDRAKTLLNRSFYVDSKEEGSSAIHLAAQAGNLEAVKFLIAQGADVDDPDAQKRTPLMLAAARGDLAMTEFLVGKGASLRAVSATYRTPLMTAVVFGRDSVVDFLLKKMKDPLFEPVTDGMTNPSNALFLAVECPNTVNFEKLFAQNPDPNLQLRDGRTLLMAAADANSPALVMKLLSMHADNSRLDRWGNSALHHACKGGADSAILEQLLLNGADPDGKNKNRQTPLHFAVASKKPANVRVLLRGKIDVEQRDLWKETPLQVAMGMDLKEIVQLLVDKGAKPVPPPLRRDSSPVESSAGVSDSIPVVSDNSPEFAKLAIASGVDVNAKVYPYRNAGEDRYGRFLTIAARHGWNEVIDLAMSKGADPSLTDGEHRNPLQCALERRQYGAFQLLLKRGAKVDSSLAGEYLRWLMAAADSLNATSVLLKRGADVNDRSRSGQTPLMLAAKGKQLMNLKALLNAKADPTLRDGRGRSALHEAIDSGCFECAKLLVEKGAPVKDAFPESQSLVSLAVARQDTVMAKWLLAKGAPPVLTGDAYGKVFGQKGSDETARFVLRKMSKLDLGAALLEAATTRNTDLIRLLIEKHADVNVRDGEGRTPLMISCIHHVESSEEVRALLKRSGAKLKLRDNSGWSTEDYCSASEGE